MKLGDTSRLKKLLGKISSVLEIISEPAEAVAEGRILVKLLAMVSDTSLALHEIDLAQRSVSRGGLLVSRCVKEHQVKGPNIFVGIAFWLPSDLRLPNIRVNLSL